MAASSGEGRSLRERCRLTRRMVADHLGVTVQTIEKWERGTAMPDADHAEAYALLLDDLRALVNAEAAA